MDDGSGDGNKRFFINLFRRIIRQIQIKWRSRKIYKWNTLCKEEAAIGERIWAESIFPKDNRL